MRQLEDGDTEELKRLCARYEKACGERFYLGGGLTTSAMNAGLGSCWFDPFVAWEALRDAIEAAIKRKSPLTVSEVLEIESSCNQFRIEGARY